jgi:phenylpyruvate tautomerase PptA (4-oxalocrotonate tautomerase family)
MPTVKIELLKGRDNQTLLQIRDLVMDSVVEVLQLSVDHRNMRVIEYDADFFHMKPPYQILIEITMFHGRPKDIKKKLFQTITDRFESGGFGLKTNLLIIINEQPRENWGVRGGIPGDEI